MADLFYLTQKDRDLLDKLANMFLGQPTPNGPYDPEPHIPYSPEVYIALVPEEGIPAATDNTGDGSPELQAGDKPGSTKCDIYRVVIDELKYCGFSRRIYNLSSSDITEGWLLVKKDKFGLWFADTGDNGIYEGILDEDLDAADNTKDGPSTAMVNRYRKVDGKLEEDEESDTITNRDTSLTLEKRTYVIYTKINGELRILWAACEAEESSSSME